MAYHSENWDLLAAALKTDNFGGIEAVNRLQLIEDSFNLASTNHVSFDQFFKIIEYLRAETEVVVWDTAESIIFTLHKYYQQERYSEFEVGSDNCNLFLGSNHYFIFLGVREKTFRTCLHKFRWIHQKRQSK